MTDSGSRDPATQEIEAERKRLAEMQGPSYTPIMGSIGPGIDQALTAAREEPVERLARMLWEADDPSYPWEQGSERWHNDFKTQARRLLAHADVLADILNQAKETK